MYNAPNTFLDSESAHLAAGITAVANSDLSSSSQCDYSSLPSTIEDLCMDSQLSAKYATEQKNLIRFVPEILHIRDNHILPTKDSRFATNAILETGSYKLEGIITDETLCEDTKNALNDTMVVFDDSLLQKTITIIKQGQESIFNTTKFSLNNVNPHGSQACRKLKDHVSKLVGDQTSKQELLDENTKKLILKVVVPEKLTIRVCNTET
ncbi:predicted protein [Plenodomus lingam JN3]|uniref:Predicted protein n=1 Tax=Leptosphaeria maculans (strain JN3 / isolate v23.1.3 / race Av1-4-5-6-7-8) TaxID=985895 RepID=E4ZQQ9_LEPMJ|nr:predicted protein [Plenodomus lingam JN3]CBX94064.1 predicted protein [Plenodomus lingam JN3]